MTLIPRKGQPWRWILWLAAAGALYLLTHAVPSGAAGEALAYDQIERVVSNDAPIPAPDAFIINEEETRAEVGQAGGERRGLARVVSSLGRRGPGSTLGAVADDLRRLGFPRLEQHVFYRGWERVENLVTGIVVLRKCDVGMQLTLDPAHQTYRVDDPIAADRARLVQRAQDDRPGSAMLDLDEHVDPEPARTIEGVTAGAYHAQTTMHVQDASGSCRATSISADSRTYYAPMRAPVSSCPRAAPDFPSTPLTAVARDGCRPAVTAQRTGSAEPSTPLVLYRLLILTEGNERLQLLTARGNVHEVPDPGPLFEVPAGYSKSS